MRVFTSHFNKIKYLERNNVIPVSISRFPPKDFKGESYFNLAPSKEILLEQKETPNWVRYKDKFYSELLFKNIAEIIKDLEAISEKYDGKDIALCCYEEDYRRCHRSIVAEFFNKFGIFGGDVHEFSENDTVIQNIELF